MVNKLSTHELFLYYSQRYTADDTDDDLACEGCSFSTDLCICSAILDSFKKVKL